MLKRAALLSWDVDGAVRWHPMNDNADKEDTCPVSSVRNTDAVLPSCRLTVRRARPGLRRNASLPAGG